MKRFGLSAGERLKNKSDFEKIYTAGKVVFSGDKIIKANYIAEKISGTGEIKIAFAVSGKAGKAFWRNRLKRLLRTSYRLNKENLINLCLLNSILLNIIFSPYHLNESKNPVIKLEDVMPGMKEILLKIGRSL